MWYHENIMDYATNWEGWRTLEALHFPYYDILGDFWYLTSLAVHPNARRKGNVLELVSSQLTYDR